MPSDYLRLAPPVLRDFLSYHQHIKMHSPKTVEEYFLDLRTFLRYLKYLNDPSIEIETFDQIPIRDVNIELLRQVTSSDILSFLGFLSQKQSQMTRHGRSSEGMSARTKARKQATLRSFFQYLIKNAHLLETNPVLSMDSPKIPKTLPRYLSETECNQLLDSVTGRYAVRDYAIILLLLSCGLRVSELVGINLMDLREDTLRVRGKGNKERMLFLNEACLDAIEDYRFIRPVERIVPQDKEALFISRNFRRMTPRSVQMLVDKALFHAGLDSESYSPHKLRHSAATLMLKNGVDVRTLQDVLGHENLNTTQIYTHIDNESLRKAALSNPMGKRKRRPED